jgi:hypothetical protein
MEIYAAALIIAMLVLIGNLSRLLYCTIKNCKKNPENATKSILLFIMYLVITSVFVYCAGWSLCDMFCPHITG